MDAIESFGCNVFGNKVMKERLSSEDYIKILDVIEGNSYLTTDLAEAVAKALRKWAIERGATHYTHWFQPMTGLTAEKHDAFFSPAKDGSVILDFSGKQLVKGEADASAFPSGGLRASFEARGYTAWDCTSPPFLRKDYCGATTLCIPTAFCAFSGEALDEKTPLLRSMSVLSKQSKRVLKHLGVETKRVVPTVGAEQEYFLIDKQLYQKRKDLIYTGRTLFGAQPSKGQELEDQYYASMSQRVSAFMFELNSQLWKLGVPAKTQHYEAAPSQYELAPMFSTANIAVDHNQITMDVMAKVAQNHNFALLLHEKPFKGVNGSGKHNNWALQTDEGVNLLKPAKPQEENLVFLAFFVAIIAAVDEYSKALGMSCASLSNSARLGESEAPPSIISIFVGQSYCNMLSDYSNGFCHTLSEKQHMTMGVSSLPVVHKDEADRNRTSPFAFTGNKFEFRMAGSSQSIGFVNTVLNTIVAQKLSEIADELDSSEKPKEHLLEVIRHMTKKHERVLFNGNSYSEQWREEAKKRGLPILKDTIDSIESFSDEKIISVFERHGVLSRTELEARKEINLKAYIKRSSIEARTVIKMSHQSILPACLKYSGQVATQFCQILEAGQKSNVHKKLLENLLCAIEEYSKNIENLEQKHEQAQNIHVLVEQAKFFCNEVVVAVEKTRKCADELEKMVDKKLWPLPSYGEMLYNT